MKFDKYNPWLIGIIGGAIGAILAGIVSFYLFEYKEKKRSKNIIITSIYIADQLIGRNMFEDAIEKYNNILQQISMKEDKGIYSYIKSRLGDCYFELSEKGNVETNLVAAIKNYEDALKIKAIEKLPVYYAMIQNGLGKAYGKLSEVRNTEENLNKAMIACKEALKIRTIEKYPDDYVETQNIIGNIYLKLSEVRN